jgi:phage tail-like protein
MALEDPLIGYSYGLEMGGKIAGIFMEVSGISNETDIAELKAVSPTGIQYIHKVPGRGKCGDITMKRGITDAHDFWNWRKMVEDGNIEGARTDVSLLMFDQMMTPIAKWDLTAAWPIKVTGPSFNTTSSDLLVEELSLACDYLERVAP